MYITRTQADTILEAQGYDDQWSEKSDTEKDEYIQRASDRIDAIPFNIDLEIPRFKDGNYAAFNGEMVSGQTMPYDLQVATAVLAGWYVLNPHVDDVLLPTEGTQAAAISPFMADLPLRVQTALYPYLTEEAKGTQYLFADANRRRVNARIGEREHPRPRSGKVSPVRYV